MEICNDQVIAEYRRQMDRCADFRGRFVPNGYMFTAQGYVPTLDQFEPRDDDIFLISYPKSGTTWMAEILSLLLQKGDEGLPFDRVLALQGFEDGAALVRRALSDRNLKSLFQIAVIAVLKQFRGEIKPGRRIIFTHYFPDWLPEGKHKIIYMVRNPKDVVVSYHYFHQMFLLPRTEFTMNWEDFFKVFLAEQCMFGSWFEHVKSYYKLARDNPNVMIVSYEDLKLDVEAKIGEIGKFIGVEADEQFCKEIAESTRFERLAEKRGKIKARYAKLFTRKGVVGDWKNYFTVAQNRIFDQVYAKKIGSSF